MAAHACPADVEGLLAVVQHVPPAVAIQASGGFFLAFFGVDSFLTYDKAIGEYCVGIFGFGHNG